MINHAERKELAKIFIYMARIYSFNMDQTTLSAMLDDLQDLPFSALMAACKNYRDNPKNERFPRPAKLRDLVNPTASPDALAREASARVVQAVSRFGYPNGKEAQDFIGELGWRAVERFGGWAHLCQNLGVSISQDTFYAQVRDLCRSTLELMEAGIRDQPIMIEELRGQVLELAKDLAEQKKLGAADEPELTGGEEIKGSDDNSDPA